ncbi:hypothetical protein [Achromobacter xylosoxidans]|uniref:hypothetical protein n=1 Tax=Alcaligenes xylosoxydans xylosoxydans TaxID=85698 RepID=UPI000B493A13|nr:hypothetical protein [Achromobacter xylosoxidans]
MNNPASIAQLGLTDDEIEAIALKHVAPGAKTLREIVPGLAPYQQSWQFQRIKAFLIDALAARRAPVAGEAQQDLAPPECPITRRPFFMTMEHPELGWVPTYGGPYDSYSIPYMGGEAYQPWHERELFVRRYDHDLGGWREDEEIPLRVIHEDVIHELKAAAPQASAEALVRYCPGCGSVGPVEGKYRDCCPDGGEARMIPAPLAEKCRDTFKIAVKALLADAAANEAGANHVPSATEEHTLRAMARNYTHRHLWDQLDSKTIIAAADEIRALRGALSARAQPTEHGGAHG